MLSKRYSNDQVALVNLNDLQKQMVESVTGKVNDETYTFEEFKCPVCGSEEMRRLSEKDRYGLFMPVGICTCCGLSQTNPRMNQDSYNQFYDNEYRSLYVGKDMPTENFFAKQYRRGKSIYRFLDGAAVLSKPIQETSVLEVGCGAGGILQYFRERGCTVRGIDLGGSYLNYGVDRYGLDLEQTSLAELNLEEKPDVIIYAHVFEHILDLPRELELIRQIAHEDTVLYIEVPGLMNIHVNYEMDLLSYLQNAHTFHFTRKSLGNVLRKGGFELSFADEFVRSIAKVAEVQDTSFENCFDETLAYLQKMEAERGSLANQLTFLSRRTKNALVRTIKSTGLMR